MILRFELEQELLAGTVDARRAAGDLERADARSTSGSSRPNDRLGVLQDMHWAGGHIGYFSTYALGNVISVQIWETLLADLPDVHAQFEQGEFGAAPRLADGAPLSPRPQVHPEGDAGARSSAARSTPTPTSATSGRSSRPSLRLASGN